MDFMQIFMQEPTAKHICMLLGNIWDRLHGNRARQQFTKNAHTDNFVQ